MSHPRRVFDSSVWIEVLNFGPIASACEKLLASSEILIPSLILYEVYKKFAQVHSDDKALEVSARLGRYTILDLDSEVAIEAAELSLRHKLPAMDSLMLAHAYLERAEFVTLDNDFSGLPDVRVLRA